MSLPSQFQQLPKKVLKSICKHVMPIIGDNTGPRPGIALLRTDWFDSLGSAWREVALEHYFEHFTLAFNSGSGKINSTHPVDDGFISIERECHTLTAVKICVAMNDLLSGKAAHMLAKSKYSPLVFPSVETMKIDINEFYKSGWTLDTASAARTQSLYQQLQVMFPGVKSIQLMKGSHEAPDVETINCKFEQFVLGLFTRFNGVCATFELKGAMVGEWETEDIYSTVTELTLFKKFSFSGKYELVRKCAPTLKKLTMHDYTGQAVLSVFTEASGKPVEYPSLTTLNLARGNGPGNGSYVACPQLLLPRLAHLTIEGGHPFNNDVLYRSACKTLEYASIIVSPGQLDIHIQHCALLGPKYPNLQYVRMGYCAGHGMADKREPEAYWQYVYSLAQNLKGLTIPYLYGWNHALEKLLEGPAFESVRYINLEYQGADFYSVCSLIEKMPQLVRLCVEELEIESDYDYTCRSKLYNDFTSEWPVLSHQFKYCDVVRETNIEDLATFGMLLAVMCPRFTRFMSNSRSWKLVQEEIDAAILEEPFIEHAEKLKLLTYNGIPEGSETFAVKQVY
ncbi:hypothetical protein GGI06_002340, partial [Coemansia sp. S85]